MTYGTDKHACNISYFSSVFFKRKRKYLSSSPDDNLNDIDGDLDTPSISY